MKTALITGASAGIGYEYALQLAQLKKWNLFLVARRLERLQELKTKIESKIWKNLEDSPKLKVLKTDLNDQSSLDELLVKIDNGKTKVDLLVNNAGFGSVGPFAKSNLETELNMVSLNCLVPLKLTRHFLPIMKQQNHGTIINVCSTASFQPLPYMATYGATKAFLFSFSQALAAEAQDYGVQVLAHCPGPTDTEFHLVAGLSEKMSHLPAMKTKQVVREALKAIEQKKWYIVNGTYNKLLAKLSRLLPPPQSAKIVRHILKAHSH